MLRAQKMSPGAQVVDLGPNKAGAAVEAAVETAEAKPSSLIIAGLTDPDLVQAPDTLAAMYTLGIKAVDFDGAAEYLTTPHHADFDFDSDDPFSVSAWIKSDDEGYESIVGKMASAEAYRGWQLLLCGGHLTLYLISTNPSDDLRVSTILWLADNNLHHVVGTYNGGAGGDPILGSSMTLYVDGVSVATHVEVNTLSSGDDCTNSQTVDIGRTNYGNYFDGFIGSVSIWNTELAAAKVTELYNSGTPGNLLSHSMVANLKGWWKTGDGLITASDSTDSSDAESRIYDEKAMHDLTVVNTEAADIVSVSPGGISTTSVVLDGSNEYLTAGSSSDDFNYDYNEAFSVSVWIKTSSVAWGLFASKMGATISRGWYLGLNQYDAADGTVFFGLISTFGSNMIFFDEGTAILNDNAWHHVCVTKSTATAASAVKIYVDGVADTLDGTYSGNDTLSTTTTNANAFEIGARGGGAGGQYNGHIDEVSTWDKELSSAEVVAMYNSGAPTNLLVHSANANLVAWWRMGDGAPTEEDSTDPANARARIYDMSANTHHMTPVATEAADIQDI